MMLQLAYAVLWAASARGMYVSRMTTVGRFPPRGLTAFRPGVTLPHLQRQPSAPWLQRAAQAPSQRAPYVLYRNQAQGGFRYMKPAGQSTRSVIHVNTGPWKATRPMTAELDFLRAASGHIPTRILSNGAKGGIHTVPAPNLSLSEKPIVVIDATENFGGSPQFNGGRTESPKTSYEVTEKLADPVAQKLGTKALEATPVGFSKGNSQSDLIMRNNAALQLAHEYGLSAIALPPGQLTLPPSLSLQEHHSITGPPQPPVTAPAPQPISVQPQQTITVPPQQPITVQHQQPMQIQGYHGMLPHPQSFVQPSLDGLIIQPNALYQADPSFLQKLQNQLLQRYQSIEFVPYNAGHHPHYRMPPNTQNQMYFVNNDAIHHHHQQQLHNVQIAAAESENHKNVVRETQESTVATAAPEVANVTENQIEAVSTSEPQNDTIVELEAAESQPSTTVKYVLETSTPDQKTTPIYYAQVGQTIGSVTADGFYSSINDARAAEALTLTQTPQMDKKEDTTTTTESSSVKHYVLNGEPEVKNFTTEFPLRGVPFSKPDPANVAYTLVRADDKENKVNKDGNVYAGQLVEASITEDHDFNNQKAELLAALGVNIKGPTIRFTNTENKGLDMSSTTPRFTVVKARIPPKSKLTFDDKTGEPVLRIYASYIDSPLQKEAIASKLGSIRHVNEVVARKQEGNVDWKSAAVKALEKDTHLNKMSSFGLKLKTRMDDIIPIFEDYD